jgi:hypothetical protein
MCCNSQAPADPGLLDINPSPYITGDFPQANYYSISRLNCTISLGDLTDLSSHKTEVTWGRQSCGPEDETVESSHGPGDSFPG